MIDGIHHELLFGFTMSTDARFCCMFLSSTYTYTLVCLRGKSKSNTVTVASRFGCGKFLKCKPQLQLQWSMSRSFPSYSMQFVWSMFFHDRICRVLSPFSSGSISVVFVGAWGCTGSRSRMWQVGGNVHPIVHAVVHWGEVGSGGGGLNEMFQVLIVFILDFITHLTETIKVMVLCVCENKHLGDSRPFFGWVSPLACFFWREWCLHSRW